MITVSLNKFLDELIKSTKDMSVEERHTWLRKLYSLYEDYTSIASSVESVEEFFEDISSYSDINNYEDNN